MNSNCSNWALAVEAIKALAWPFVTVIIASCNRESLKKLIEEFGRRAKKLSVLKVVAVELDTAKLKERQAQWTVQNQDVRRLSQSCIFDSCATDLMQELLKPAQTDYAIVNVGSGHSWLVSRLFIFALILGDVTGLRSFVFLETTANTRQRFLGVSTPKNVRQALSKHYPWLEEAAAIALTCRINRPEAAEKPGVSKFVHWSSPIVEGAYPFAIAQFVREFLEILQRKTDPPEAELRSYLKLDSGTDGNLWERTSWLDGERLIQDLYGVLQFDWVEDTYDNPKHLARAIINKNAPFVALVDRDRRFLDLVDRNSLLSNIARRISSSEDE